MRTPTKVETFDQTISMQGLVLMQPIVFKNKTKFQYTTGVSDDANWTASDDIFSEPALKYFRAYDQTKQQSKEYQPIEKNEFPFLYFQHFLILFVDSDGSTMHERKDIYQLCVYKRNEQRTNERMDGGQIKLFKGPYPRRNGDKQFVPAGISLRKLTHVERYDRSILHAVLFLYPGFALAYSTTSFKIK